MMTLLSAYLSSLSPPYSGVLAMLLCSSLTDTCNGNLGTNCDSNWNSMDYLRQAFAIEKQQPESFVEYDFKDILWTIGLFLYGCVSLVYFTTT